MDCIVHGVTKSRAQLSDFHSLQGLLGGSTWLPWRRKWYSCLENPVDRGAWWAAVHGVTQSWTQLKHLSMHALEKEMATHSSILAWRILETEEPGRLPSMGSHRVRHN